MHSCKTMGAFIIDLMRHSLKICKFFKIQFSAFTAFITVCIKQNSPMIVGKMYRVGVSQTPKCKMYINTTYKIKINLPFQRPTMTEDVPWCPIKHWTFFHTAQTPIRGLSYFHTGPRFKGPRELWDGVTCDIIANIWTCTIILKNVYTLVLL